MSTTVTRALSAATALAALALPPVLAAAPVHAATATFTDAAGDIAHSADLRSVAVNNTAENVRVTLTVRDLAPTHGVGAAVFLDTDGEPGPEYALVAGLTGGADYYFVRTDSWKLGRARTPMTCSHRLRLDDAADTARIRIGKDCLAAVPGDGTVRVEVRTSGTTADGTTVVDWLGGAHTFGAAIAQG